MLTDNHNDNSNDTLKGFSCSNLVSLISRFLLIPKDHCYLGKKNNNMTILFSLSWGTFLPLLKNDSSYKIGSVSWRVHVHHEHVALLSFVFVGSGMRIQVSSPRLSWQNCVTHHLLESSVKVQTTSRKFRGMFSSWSPIHLDICAVTQIIFHTLTSKSGPTVVRVTFVRVTIVKFTDVELTAARNCSQGYFCQGNK